MSEELAALALRIVGFDQEAEEVFTSVTVFEVGKLIPHPAQRGFGRLDGVGPFADVKQLVRQRQCQMGMMANGVLTHAQKAVGVAAESEEMEQNARLVGVAVLELQRVDTLQSRFGFRSGLDGGLQGVLPGLRPQVVGIWRKDGDETFDQAVFIRPSRCIGDTLGPILQRTLGFAVTSFRDIIVFPIRAVRIVLVIVVTL